MPITACLSGGLDSSLVTSFMAQNNAGNLKSVLHVESSSAKNERAYAEQVANQYGLKLEIIKPTSEIFENFADVMRAQDEPFGSPSIFMSNCIQTSELIRQESGFKWSRADELFMGYKGTLLSKNLKIHIRLCVIQYIVLVIISKV